MTFREYRFVSSAPQGKKIGPFLGVLPAGKIPGAVGARKKSEIAGKISGAAGARNIPKRRSQENFLDSSQEKFSCTRFLKRIFFP